MVNMRVVSVEPEHELTLTADQPTPMYITTRISDVGNDRTRVARSFDWEQPEDPEIARGVRDMMEAMVIAGEAAIKEVFEERAAAARARAGSAD